MKIHDRRIEICLISELTFDTSNHYIWIAINIVRIVR